MVDSVIDDREEVVLTSAGQESVVIMPLGDFRSLRETAHATRDPAKARRLLDAVERLEQGQGEVHDLVGTD